jgi:type IV secretion system protein VirB11
LGANATSVLELLRPIQDLLASPEITELCINRPGEVFLESASRWSRREVPEATHAWALSLAIAAASYGAQPLSRAMPFLSVRLPAGERMQGIVPPACASGRVVFSIRSPYRARPSLHEFERAGAFEATEATRTGPSAGDLMLLDLLKRREIRAFLECAVLARKNIAVVGDTGSGKTTLMRALCELIDPAQRLVTIEDTHELEGLPINSANLFYGEALGIVPADCIRAALRLRPDRVILAELRGAEAFDFLNVLMTGHPGSITSFHAESCSLALERFALMAGSHPAAHSYSEAQLIRLARLTIDIVAHLGRADGRRRLTSIDFDPTRRYLATPQG